MPTSFFSFFLLVPLLATSLLLLLSILFSIFYVHVHVFFFFSFIMRFLANKRTFTLINHVLLLSLSLPSQKRVLALHNFMGWV